MPEISEQMRKDVDVDLGVKEAFFAQQYLAHKAVRNHDTPNDARRMFFKDMKQMQASDPPAYERKLKEFTPVYKTLQSKRFTGNVIGITALVTLVGLICGVAGMSIDKDTASGALKTVGAVVGGGGLVSTVIATARYLTYPIPSVS